jgi:NADPH-dependent 2,4-dienoyl-CoA reductase/sulfur reductase-like enzyme
VSAIRPHGVELTDGTTITTETVLVALGALPNTDWLNDTGLTLDPGLHCDATLTSTEDPDILAAGDIVSWPHPLADGNRVRVEHWTTAAEHGQIAGRNALLPPEERATHEVPPYFWSDQYEVKIQAVGFSNLADQIEILEATPTEDRLVAVGTKHGRVISVVGFNAARRLAWYRGQLISQPSLEEIKAQVSQDESALGAPIGAAT